MPELIIGLHCHQPVGNFPFVFREAYEKSYRPILEALERSPKVRVSLHYSGPLLEWLEKEELAYLARVRHLVERGQVELWGSGFYEPILPAIPRRDRIEQVRMMADRIEQRFGKRPRGLWLTERVWEPTLASDLAEAGVDYIAVDDHHFRLAGLDPEQLGGYYLTEDEGRTLGVFPILKELRYRIPFAEPEKVLEFVRERAGAGAPVPTFYDDGEKLGVWPKTYEAVWEKGWIRRLFDMLSSSDVTTVLPAEVRDRDKPQGRIYLPTASYPEMMEWAFPAETGTRFEELLDKIEHDPEEGRWRDVKPFLAGGFWRNFLVKFPEVNFLQKRVVRASRLIRERVPERSRGEALRELFQAECNCAYWHGVFGGTYLPHLRRALWHHLLRAENAFAPARLTTEVSDLEADGHDVLRIDHPAYSAHVKPGTGGQLLALDLREPAFPLLDMVARRREAYHARFVPAAAAPAGAQQGGIHGRIKVLPEGVELVEDWHRRASAVDHVYGELPTAELLANARVRDQGDFAIEPFRSSVEESDDALTVTLVRDGGVFSHGQRRPLRLTRTLAFSKKRVSVSVYTKVENTSRDGVEGWLASDWNLALVPVESFVWLQLRSPDGTELVHPDPKKPTPWKGPLPPQKIIALDPRPFVEVGFKDDTLGRRVRLIEGSRQAQVALYPVTTVSQSEAGVDLVHQGTCFTVLRQFKLAPGASASFALEVVVEGL